MQLNEAGTHGKGAGRADPGFMRRLTSRANGESLRFCYQCGTCTAACPISKLVDIYKPNKILQLCSMGIRNRPQSNAFLFCSACTLCTRNCPQGVKVHKVMEAMKELSRDDADARAFMTEGFDDAFESLAKEIPLPLAYSWICLRPSDGKEDGAFSEDIKKALGRAQNRPLPQAAKLGGAAAKVAVIGSGPAGLTAAWELVKAGVRAVIFESLPEPGGMLRTGIPGYRLPKDVLASEIERIKALGVEINTGVTVDRTFFEELIGGNGYSAVFIATGMLKSRKLGLDGEELSGVIPALDYLKEFNFAGKAKAGGKVVVIGGGNVAIDAAGAAVRSGSASVRLFYRRDRADMPAHEWEIEDAIADGVEMNYLWAPMEILRQGGAATGVRFVRSKSVIDKDGKRTLVLSEKETIDVEADIIIPAIGQAPDLSFLAGGIATGRGGIQIDPYTMETSLPGVFVGGDVVSESASFLEAIAGGKTAARSIAGYLKGGATINETI